MNQSFLIALFAILLSCSLCPAQLTPQNDTLFSRQKEMFEKRGVFEAWKITEGNPEIRKSGSAASTDHIILVGATNANDTRWTMSNGTMKQGSDWGELLDVCGPAQNLVVCQPSDKRFYTAADGPMGAEEVPWSGNICDVMPLAATSGAAPVVSSLAALVYSIAPGMTAPDVKKAILDGCDDIGEKGVDLYTGHGRINFGKTISLVNKRRQP